MIQIDISMPKGCWSCPYHKVGRNGSVCVVKQRGKKINKTWNLGDARQKWCPIKEVDIAWMPLPEPWKGGEEG